MTTMTTHGLGWRTRVLPGTGSPPCRAYARVHWRLGERPVAWRQVGGRGSRYWRRPAFEGEASWPLCGAAARAGGLGTLPEEARCGE